MLSCRKNMLLNAPGYLVRTGWLWIYLLFNFSNHFEIRWVSILLFTAMVVAALWCIISTIRNRNHIGWAIVCATFTVLITLHQYYSHCVKHNVGFFDYI